MAGISNQERYAYQVLARQLCRTFAEPHNACACMKGRPCSAERTYHLEAATILAGLKREGLLLGIAPAKESV